MINSMLNVIMCYNEWSGFVAGGFYIGGTDEADEGFWIWVATGRYIYIFFCLGPRCVTGQWGSLAKGGKGGLMGDSRGQSQPWSDVA